MEMARSIMSTHLMIMELYDRWDRNEYDSSIPGLAALTKYQATRSFEFCAREASQIIGGKSYLRSGVGARVERLYREVRVYAIGGGSEEVMLDLAARQARL